MYKRQATFSAEWTPAQTEETVLLGEVSYVLNYGNTTKTYSSTGKLYLAGSAPLVVQVKDTSATVFTEDDNEMCIRDRN